MRQAECLSVHYVTFLHAMRSETLEDVRHVPADGTSLQTLREKRNIVSCVHLRPRNLTTLLDLLACSESESGATGISVLTDSKDPSAVSVNARARSVG